MPKQPERDSVTPGPNSHPIPKVGFAMSITGLACLAAGEVLSVIPILDLTSAGHAAIVGGSVLELVGVAVWAAGISRIPE